MPVLALRVFAVLAVVRCDVAVRISPDRLEDPRPRVANADIPSPAGAGWDLLSVLVQDHGKNPGYRRARAAGFHRIQRRLGTAQEPTIFRLPPSIHDHGLPFADDVVIPPPHVRFDRFTDRGHMFEVVVVLSRLVRAGFAEHSDGRRRGMEDINTEPLG